MHATTLAEVIGKVNNGYPVDKLISGVARTKLCASRKRCVQEQISEHIFAQMEAIVFVIL